MVIVLGLFTSTSVWVISKVFKGILAVFSQPSSHPTRILSRMDGLYYQDSQTPRGKVSSEPSISILPAVLSHPYTPHHPPVTAVPQSLHGMILGMGNAESGGEGGTMEGLGWVKAWSVSLSLIHGSLSLTSLFPTMKI